MDLTFFAQILGLVSFALGISTFYQKDDRRLKIIMVIFNTNHLIHYILLGSVPAAASSFISVLRTGTSIFTSSKYVAAIFIALALAMSFKVVHSVADIWAPIGTIIGTYSLFILKGIKMRIAFILGASCWLTNNILVGSIGGTMLEMTAITMNSITIFRIYRDRKRQDTLPSPV